MADWQFIRAAGHNGDAFTALISPNVMAWIVYFPRKVMIPIDFPEKVRQQQAIRCLECFDFILVLFFFGLQLRRGHISTFLFG